MDRRDHMGILSRAFARHHLSLPSGFTFSFKSKPLSKAPQALADAGIFLVRMFSGVRNFADRILRSSRSLQCLSSDEVYECHRELGIIQGYRNENCSVLQALVSLFRKTNETMNFWTHFLPSVYFVWLLFSLASSLSLFSDEYMFPFVCYMITSCAYPLVSCFAHAFSCLSPTTAHICYFMDYATLSLYSWGAAILYYNYVFPTIVFRSHYATLFLPVAALMTVITTFAACCSRTICTPSLLSKFLRLGSFVIPYLWVSMPLIWRLIHCDASDHACTISGTHHIRQFLAVFLASFFYGSHMPERFAPGKFDFIGHSHNLLHLFGVLATYEQMIGSLIDLKMRRQIMENVASLAWVTIVTPSIVFVNFLIVYFFVQRLKTRTTLKLGLKTN